MKESAKYLFSVGVLLLMLPFLLTVILSGKGAVSVSKDIDIEMLLPVRPVSYTHLMVGHISLPQITGDGTPAVLSEAVMNQMLRQELGFQGIIITDALNMGAITENYTTEDAAVQAILAGADMLLMPADFQKAYQAVLNAVNDGRITRERLDESVLRILKLKCSEDL